MLSVLGLDSGYTVKYTPLPSDTIYAIYARSSRCGGKRWAKGLAKRHLPIVHLVTHCLVADTINITSDCYISVRKEEKIWEMFAV